MFTTRQTTAPANNGRLVASFLLLAVKAVALWVVLTAATISAGTLMPVHMPPTVSDGPVTVMPAFIIANGTTALARGLIAGPARVRGWHRVLPGGAANIPSTYRAAGA